MVQEAVVDFVNDLQMPRQDVFKEGDRPRFQRLGHQGVIGVPQRCLGDLPGLLPGQVMFVYEHAHQFRDRHRRVGVIELNGDLRRRRHRRWYGSADSV